MNNRPLLHGLTAFLCGVMVMVLEMTGSRMLAPYLGTSLIVWTSLIGVVLASLSFGYWYGGIIADRFPKTHLLAKIIFAAGLVVALVGGSYTFMLQPLSTGTLNLYIAALSAAAILFAVPGALLGMVSPFLARLAIDNVGSSGRTVGRLYALSSLGSILGTFLGGFILVSLLKTGTILFLIAAVLVLVAFFLQCETPPNKGNKNIPGKKMPNKAAATFFALLFVGAGGWYHVFGDSLLPEALHHRDTPYNHIRVYDSGSLRSYQTDPGLYSQSTIIVGHPERLASRYFRYVELAFFYRPDIRNVAVIGGGGYVLPNYLLATRPEVAIDVVEIDPGVTAVAREFFDLKDDSRLQIFHEDARRFLRRTKNETKKYDLLFGDTFNSHYGVPFHLLTRECLEEISHRLSDDGIYMVNIIASAEGPKRKLFEAFHRTLSEVFTSVDVFMVGGPTHGDNVQNIVLVGFKGKSGFPDSPDAPMDVRQLLNHRWTKPVPQTVPPLRDALAPVEWYLL